MHTTTATERAAELPPRRETAHGSLRAMPFESNTNLPTDANAVIIGGGISGVLTAWFLARRGLSVVLCEKAELACESSSRAFGWVAELLTAPDKVHLTQLSKAIWREIHARVGDSGYRQHGLSYLADSNEEMQAYADWLGSVRGIGDPATRLLDADAVAALYPSAKRRFAGAIHAPSDGAIEPIITTARVAQDARRAGALIVTHCAVRGLDLQAGSVAGVFTEKGYVRTSAVLCAANAWSRIFCGNHGVEVPQLYAILSMGRTGPVDGPVGSGGKDNWAWRRQIDGTYSLGGLMGVKAPITRDALKLYRLFRPLIKAGGSYDARPSLGRDAWNDWRIARRWDPRKESPFERRRVLCGTADPRVAARSLQRNTEVFGEMGAAAVAETWSGALTFTPDNTPIAGAVSQIPGFFLMTGFNYGFSWGPALARMVADLMAGDQPSLDPAPFRLERFYDGSKLEISP